MSTNLDRTLEAIDRGLLDVGKQSSEEWAMPLSEERRPPRTAQSEGPWEHDSTGEAWLRSDPFYASAVYIFDPLNRNGRGPVFHAEGGAHWRDGLQEHMTACGLVTSRWTAGTNSRSSETLAIHLLRKHAELFARPCERCFREEPE